MASLSTSLLATCWTTSGTAGPLIGNDLSEYSLVERIEAAGAAGFNGFGLVDLDLRVAEQTVGWAAIRDALTSAGMEHLEIEMLNDWYQDGDARKESDAAREYLLGAAEFFSPRHLKVGGDISGATTDLARIAAEFAALCADFKVHGCAVAFEIMPFGEIASIEKGRRMLDLAQVDNGGLMLDLWHIARSESTFDEISDLPPGYLLAVELDDTDAQTYGTLLHDTLHHRRLPGEGSEDVAAFVRAVRATGFEGPWGVEIISDEHRAKGLHEQVSSAFTTCMTFLDSVE